MSRPILRLDEPHRSSVLNAIQELYRRGLTIGSLGNVSVRGANSIWITPTRKLPERIQLSDICVVGMNGGRVGDGTPSRELPLHLGLYRAFPMVGAVVHTHSPWATAWSYLCEDLDLETEELEYHRITRIPCTPSAPAGSSSLAERAIEALQDAPVALLGRHGVVAMGPDIDDAMCLAQIAEQQAQIQWLTRLSAELPRAESASRGSSAEPFASATRKTSHYPPRSSARHPSA
jgi:L-fuculose-phosphate aldolase